MYDDKNAKALEALEAAASSSVLGARKFVSQRQEAKKHRELQLMAQEKVKQLRQKCGNPVPESQLVEEEGDAEFKAAWHRLDAAGSGGGGMGSGMGSGDGAGGGDGNEEQDGDENKNDGDGAVAEARQTAAEAFCSMCLFVGRWLLLVGELVWEFQ